MKWLICTALMVCTVTSGAACNRDADSTQGAAHASLAASTLEWTEHVPADAAAAGHIAVRDGIAAYASLVIGIEPGTEEFRSLWRELSDVVKRRFGLDMSKFEGVAVFGNPAAKQFGAILEQVRAAGMTGESVGAHRGVPIQRTSNLGEPLEFAQLDVGVVVGTADAVRLAIDVQAAPETSLARAPDDHVLRSVVYRAGAGPMVFAATEATGFGMAGPPWLGIRSVAVSVHQSSASTFGLVAALHGPAASLAGVETWVNTALDEAASELHAFEASARSGPDGFQEMASVMAGHGWRRFRGSMSMKTDGEYLTLESPGLGAHMFVAGTLAAVAIPAFVKYLRRAQSAEAQLQVDKIVKGAQLYYASERVDSTGQLMAPSFPPSAKATPEGSACDHPDEVYPARPELWDSPTWRALGFSVDDTHRYQYRFDSEGSGDSAKFVVTAHGDLDCDGEYSTFQRIGYGSESSRTVEMAPLEVEREFE